MTKRTSHSRRTFASVATLAALGIAQPVFAYDCTGLAAWQSNAVYTGGSKVTLENQAFEAKWWTQNQSPATNSDSYGVWKLLGNCSGNQAPTVAMTSPANNSVLAENDNAVLRANAADSDGTIASVAFFVDGQLLSTDTTSPFESNWVATLGQHQITATATDNSGASSTSTAVSVTVQAADGNIPPTISIQSPMSNAQLDLDTQVTLSVNAADSDGAVAQVTFWLGETLLATDTSAPYEHQWQAAPVGEHTLKAIVSDNQGATAMSTVNVKVVAKQSGGCAGLANYVAGQAYSAGQLVAHNNLKYRCDVAGWCSSNATWAYEPGVGQYWRDAWTEAGLCAAVPTVQFQSPAPDSTVLQGAATQISVSANDADGQISQLDVYANNTLLTSVAQSSTSFSWTPTTLGNVTLKALATDNEGNVGQTEQQLTVTDKALVTSLTAPTPGSRLVLGKAAQLQANATALAGQISEVRFYANGVLLGSDNAAPYQWTYTPAVVGNVTLNTVAKDTAGNEASSQGVAVEVVDAPLGKTHKLIGYWHNFVNPAGCPIPLSEMSPAWDVIDIAFAENDRNSTGTVHFTPFEKDIRSTCPAIDPVKFKADIKALQAQGKIFVLSLGGAEGTITLNTDSDEANFVSSLTAIVQEWGFDGLDIDLESGSNLVHGSQIQARLPRALKQIEQNLGGNMYLTMAPEHPYVHGGMIAYSGIWGAYIPLIDALRDTLDLLHVQLYNNGGLPNPYEAGSAPEGSVNMMVAHAKMLVEGFTLANGQQFAPLRDDQVAIGLPSGPKSANSGQAPTANIIAALDCLTKGTQCGTIVPAKQYSQFGGVMTWSINWDKYDGYNFSKPIGDKLTQMNQGQ
ncbi:Ig-like domain-containing protein [Pseudoalteromonas fenneropenaei]|uniref:chitinase n=1 Tax=Pseudoalteromonas fenneropenaei TaxID=1737459 RepID=A0ABV7CJ23_9GAMM